MDECTHWLHFKFESEKTGDYVACGTGREGDVQLADFAADFDFKDIEDTMEESFWEMLGEFENSVRIALEANEIDNPNEEESLFKVFGHFHAYCTLDDKEVDFDIGIDPDEFMYPKLTAYVYLDAE